MTIINASRLALLAVSLVIVIINLHYAWQTLTPQAGGRMLPAEDFAQVQDADRRAKPASPMLLSSTASDYINTTIPNKATMSILCTSTDPYINFGSYKLRCQDFATLARQCAGTSVNITTNVEIHDILMQPHIYKDYKFDATIITKSLPFESKHFALPTWLGNIYFDLVDNYKIKGSGIHQSFTLILQTERQSELFPDHDYRVVEHWYNSYPADMERGQAMPEHIPAVSNSRKIRLATVWSLKPFEGWCPTIDGIEGVSYDCIAQSFEIDQWYSKVSPNPLSEQEIQDIMTDPKYGPGKLYYDLFQNYDVLVALAKNNTFKLHFGNVQRIVSQMRSGVPVLVEVWGPVLQNFVEKYNYPCAFQREHPQLPYLGFREAMEKMKDPAARRECQHQGLEIAKDYSPTVIGKKFLRAVGYAGDFQC
jgi:hypothetical protein